MKKTLILLTTTLITIGASALDYNQSITAIFGSGNPDTGWTVESVDGITVAMRAKNRETTSTANTDGVYPMPVGYQLPANTRARWNWEFSVNSGAVNLDAYDYYIGVDTDTSVGINHHIIDAMAIPDNSYGNDTTLNGQGVEGPAMTYAGVYNIAQQSHNITFYTSIYPADPNANATYDYELYAVAKGSGPSGEKLASVAITVVVGSGGASIQDLVNACASTSVSHGDYVKCVTELAHYLNGSGVINNKQRASLISTAARSTIGN